MQSEKDSPDPSIHDLLMKNGAKTFKMECRGENLLHGISANYRIPIILMLSQAKENQPKTILFHSWVVLTQQALWKTNQWIPENLI